MKKIILAADHAGYEYKDELIKYLSGKGYTCADLGTNAPDSVDYPTFACKLCDRLLSSKEDECGILICGTGIGMSIAANRHKGIRAALCTSVDMARLCREHNNANVLCLGARTSSLEDIKAMADAYLETEFLGGRHNRRVDMLDSI